MSNMATQNPSLESGSDVEVERRDYPSTWYQLIFTQVEAADFFNSKMVPKHLLQHNHTWSLQLLSPGYLGCHELTGRWRCSVTSPRKRWQCTHVLLDGGQLLLQ